MNRPVTDIPSLRALLDETLDLGPAERATFLARLRVTHPERALELERLLAAEPGLDASRFLQSPARPLTREPGFRT